ncbi:MAG: penicillin-binding transpeptidase domain-containing protein, partial [Oscillospiraceae bacterium]
EMVFQGEDYVQRADDVQNWFVDTVYEEVISDLIAVAGYTKAGASEAMLGGGLRIYTTVDMEMQEYLERKYNIDSEEGKKTFPTIRNEVYPESAFVVLDPHTGELQAIVGSNREKAGARLFNRATSAVRHPGSTIKPLTSYSPALEYDRIHFSMLWDDNPILLKEDDPTSIWPRNYYGTYKGPITVTEAIQRSTNTIPVRLVKMLGPRTSFDFMRDKLHFSHLIESEQIGGKRFSDSDLAPRALGAMPGGVTPLDMAAAYQMFGNGGLYYEPHSYTTVLDAEGNVILEKKALPERVISAETSTIMNRLMQRVTNSAPGTGTPARFSDMPIAGKTGTSDKDLD